jgi:DtxR family transcriptional regulator, Mn-dependent transcriptional regulator
MDPRIEELLEHTYVEQVEGDPTTLDFPAEVVAAAEADGLIQRDGSRWQLTATGLPAARSVVRRHRLAECLLRDVLAVGDDKLDADACEFEHILRPGLEERVCTLLGHPTQCPHGSPIPPGDCCAKPAEGAGEVGPLSEAAIGDEGAVAYLTTRDLKEIQKLMALGILPGSAIRLEQRFPSFVFTAGYSQFTMDRELASKIIVHWHTRANQTQADAARSHRAAADNVTANGQCPADGPGRRRRRRFGLGFMHGRPGKHG